MLRIAWQGVCALASSVLAFAVWGLWLALGILLVAQLYIVSRNELDVPGFVLRRLEASLAASGLQVTFGATSFDPTGRILVEDVQARLPAFEEPVFAARAVYCRLNPWMLVVGRFEPREIRIDDATLSIPAMLSPSGRPEEIVHDFDAIVSPGDREYVLRQLSARVAGVAISVHGVLPAPRPAGPGRPDLAAWIAGQFPDLCRRATAVAEQLASFEAPSLELEARVSASGGLELDVLVLARAARFSVPVAFEAEDVRVATRVLFPGRDADSRLDFSAREVRLPFETTAHQVQAVVVGLLQAGGDFRFEPRQFDVAAGSVASNGFSAAGVSARLFPHPQRRISGAVIAHLAGAPLSVQAEADFAARTADLRFEGIVSPGLLAPVSARLGVDVRRFFDFRTLACEQGTARLGPGWKFERLSALLGAQGINAFGVQLDEGRATIGFDGRRLVAPEVHARFGANFARGSYEQELGSRQFRFLLDGQLRPLDISRWFRPWWPNFFQQFEFPAAPPTASVDLTGVWRDGAQTAVFVALQSRQPIIRGAAIDDLRTRLFVRPGMVDGLEVFATQGDGRVEGTFAHRLNLESRLWQALDLQLDSTVGLELATRILGPWAENLFAPYTLSGPPAVKLRAHFDGPGSPDGRHQSIDARVKTMGEFRFHAFPVQSPSFNLKVRDDEISVDDIETRLAGGTVAGRTRVWTSERGRRVSFDFAVKDASLGEGTNILQAFFAQRRGQPPPTPGKFVQEKANVRVDLVAAAEGAYGDPLSYEGKGTTTMRGPEIGAVALLGSLSELVKFTALRFTEAQGDFRLDRTRVHFPDVTLRGSNSAIDAHGSYAFDTGQLDFRAKVFPFQASGNLVKTVVGAVLAPLSNALEVQLTGSLEKPEWGFVLLSAPVVSLPDGPEKPAENPANATPAPAPPAHGDPLPASPPISKE